MSKLVKVEMKKELSIVYQTMKVGSYFSLKDDTPRPLYYIQGNLIVYIPERFGHDATYIEYTNKIYDGRVKEHLCGGTAV